MIRITDENGYIVDTATRKAYDRIVESGRVLSSRAERVQSAEAFLRLIERYARVGVRLI